MTEVKEYTTCRNCNSNYLTLALDLGEHAVSDFYDTVPEHELKAPLRIMLCEVCGLAQLSHSVSKDRLYKDYWYKSSGNEAMVAALQDVVRDAKRHTVSLDRWPVVLDIGANDGTLLRQYPDEFKRIGFEPSNLAASATEGGNLIYPEYFPPPWADSEPSATFSAITSIAMFYDLDDPNKFVETVEWWLHSDGVWINQMMDLESMLVNNAVDNICHEHVAYWHEAVFLNLLHKYNLRTVSSGWNHVNGGSIRHIIKHAGMQLSDHDKADFIPFNAFAAFSRRVARERELLLANLELWKRRGKRVLGYGASTKGNTLLQYYGITPDLLPAIAERNPAKVGKVTAGQHIPIISEQEMREQKPDYLLILPWAFLDNFVEREKELRANGTEFIVPLPEFRVL